MITSNDIPTSTRWSGFAASIPGSGHIRRGIPCQDASAVMTSPRPAVIVCDGRGSAKHSHLGAQEAVNSFRFQMAILEPFLVGTLDCPEEKTEQWVKICRIMYRTLMQVKYDLAEKLEEPEKEFDFTVAFAIVGKKHIGCFQVGDGSIVLRQNGLCKTVFLPEKGEYANQTHFLRPGGEEQMKFQYALFDTAGNSGIAITSDGPEHLMFRLADMTPGKIFDLFLEDLRKGELQKQDLMDYLTRREWEDDPRGADDRSLALLAMTDGTQSMPPVTAIEDEEPASQEPPKVESEMPQESEDAPEVAEPKQSATVWPWVVVSALVVGLVVETSFLFRQSQTISRQQAEIAQLKRERAIKPQREQVMPDIPPPAPLEPEPQSQPEPPPSQPEQQPKPQQVGCSKFGENHASKSIHNSLV